MYSSCLYSTQIKTLYFVIFFYLSAQDFNEQYSEACLNRTSWWATLVFRIDRCSIYPGYFNQDFLLWDFM
jgi:hypothetical protein